MKIKVYDNNLGEYVREFGTVKARVSNSVYAPINYAKTIDAIKVVNKKLTVRYFDRYNCIDESEESFDLPENYTIVFFGKY